MMFFSYSRVTVSSQPSYFRDAMIHFCRNENQSSLSLEYATSVTDTETRDNSGAGCEGRVWGRV